MSPMSWNNMEAPRNTRIRMYRSPLQDRFPQSNAIASSVRGFSYLVALKKLNLLVDDQRPTYRTLPHHNSRRTLQCCHLQLVNVRCPPSPMEHNRDRRAENEIGRPRSTALRSDVYQSATFSSWIGITGTIALSHWEHRNARSHLSFPITLCPFFWLQCLWLCHHYKLID